MRRLVLSMFLSLFFAYLVFLFLLLILFLRLHFGVRRSGSCVGFISDFYTHS